MRASMLSALWAFAVLVGAPLQSAVAAGASLCNVAFTSPEGTTGQCFRPNRVGRAERAMRVSLVRPTSVLRRLEALSLTQIKLRWNGRPLELLYLFGSLPKTATGLPDLSSRASRYMLVGELIGRVPTGPRLFKDGTGGGRFYWEYQANFACHKLTLTVDSNAPASQVRTVGRGILRAERCPQGK